MEQEPSRFEIRYTSEGWRVWDRKWEMYHGSPELNYSSADKKCRLMNHQDRCPPPRPAMDGTRQVDVSNNGFDPVNGSPGYWLSDRGADRMFGGEY